MRGKTKTFKTIYVRNKSIYWLERERERQEAEVAPASSNKYHMFHQLDSLEHFTHVDMNHFHAAF